MPDIKSTDTFNKTLSSIGPEYSSKVIDGELCGYRKLNDYYDIEISGMNNNRIKNQNFNVYVWSIKPSYEIVEKFFEIKSIEELKKILSQIQGKYQNLHQDK